MDSIAKLKSYKNQTFTCREAKKKGVDSNALIYLARSGKLKRIINGLYSFPDYHVVELTQVIGDLLKVIPHAVVGMDSAIQLYELSDQMIEDICLVVPSNNIPKRKLSGVIFYPKKANFKKMEIQKHKSIPITSINQTIVDLLKNDRPLSMVIDLFHQAQLKPELKLSISKIKKLAKIFRAKKRCQIFLEAIQ